MKWEALDGHNATEDEELWANTNYDAGQVALDDDYARAMGLPRAQRFPWDPTKGVYLLTAYHNLHCVVSQTSEHGCCTSTVQKHRVTLS